MTCERRRVSEKAPGPSRGNAAPAASVALNTPENHEEGSHARSPLPGGERRAPRSSATRKWATRPSRARLTRQPSVNERDLRRQSGALARGAGARADGAGRRGRGARRSRHAERSGSARLRPRRFDHGARARGGCRRGPAPTVTGRPAAPTKIKAEESADGSREDRAGRRPPRKALEMKKKNDPHAEIPEHRDRRRGDGPARPASGAAVGRRSGVEGSEPALFALPWRAVGATGGGGSFFLSPTPSGRSSRRPRRARAFFVGRRPLPPRAKRYSRTSHDASPRPSSPHAPCARLRPDPVAAAPLGLAAARGRGRGAGGPVAGDPLRDRLDLKTMTRPPSASRT